MIVPGISIEYPRQSFYRFIGASYNGIIFVSKTNDGDSTSSAPAIKGLEYYNKA